MTTHYTWCLNNFIPGEHTGIPTYITGCNMNLQEFNPTQNRKQDPI